MENARLFAETKRLLDETRQRNAELAVINSVQQGLVAQLDSQAIYDLVGDKIRAIFDAQAVVLAALDYEHELIRLPYAIEKGQRYYNEPYPFSALVRTMIANRQPLLVAANLPERLAEFGEPVLPGSEVPRSALWVPLIVGEQVRGIISLQNVEHENAFDQASVRLLTTLAASLSVALENARLFAETKRLLEETQQRAAELSVINSVQQGLVAQLDFQGIIDLVGDKLREVLHTGEMGIRLYDPATNVMSYPYSVELGQRQYVPPGPMAPVGFTHHVIETRQPLVINDHMPERTAEFGSYTLAGTGDTLAWLGVPILAGDLAIGVLTVESFQEHAFKDSDVRLLSTLAASLGVALENARLFAETKRLLDETQQRNAELAVINSVQQGLVAQLDLDAIYNLVGDKIRDIFDAQSVLIESFDREQRLRHELYGWEKGEYIALQGTTPFNRLIEHLIETKQTLVINQDAAAVGAQFGMTITPGTEMMLSGVFVPLIAGGAVNGFISLQNVDQENAFSPANVRLLETLAASMSVALENARLFAETQRLLDETQQRAAELAVINSVQHGLASQLDFQGVIDLVGDKLREVLHSGDFGIRLYDPATGLVSFVYSFEHGQRLTIPPAPLADMSLSRHVIETGQPFLVKHDTAGAMAALGGQSVVPGTDMSLSVMAVPIHSRDAVVGVISVESFEREDAFGEADMRLLSTLASSLSVALENARLFAETKRLLDETQQRAAELAVINSVQQGLAAQLDMQVHLLPGGRQDPRDL